MNQMLALNNPKEVDIPLNNPKEVDIPLNKPNINEEEKIRPKKLQDYVNVDVNVSKIICTP